MAAMGISGISLLLLSALLVLQQSISQGQRSVSQGQRSVGQRQRTNRPSHRFIKYEPRPEPTYQRSNNNPGQPSRSLSQGQQFLSQGHSSGIQGQRSNSPSHWYSTQRRTSVTKGQVYGDQGHRSNSQGRPSVSRSRSSLVQGRPSVVQGRPSISQGQSSNGNSNKQYFSYSTVCPHSCRCKASQEPTRNTYYHNMYVRHWLQKIYGYQEAAQSSGQLPSNHAYGREMLCLGLQQLPLPLPAGNYILFSILPFIPTRSVRPYVRTYVRPFV